MTREMAKKNGMDKGDNLAFHLIQSFKQFGTIPEGWRPAVVTHGTWSGRDGGSQRDFILETNGNFRYVNCGAGQNSGTFSGTMTYILA